MAKRAFEDSEAHTSRESARQRMSLEKVPLRITQEEAQIITKDVVTRMKRRGPSFYDPIMLCLYTVAASKGLLDPKYHHIHEVEELFLAYPELEDILKEAWEKRDLTEVLRLNILHKVKAVVPKEVEFRKAQMKATEESWKTPYYGPNASLLLNCLNGMNRSRGQNPYRNTASITQSSGTGKSRTVDECAKYLFTLPFNLRSSTDDGAFPRPDETIRDFLCSGIDLSESGSIEAKTKETYSAFKCRILTLFANIFELVKDEVDAMGKEETSHGLASKWRSRLEGPSTGGGTRRDLLYRLAVERARVSFSQDVKAATEAAEASALKLLHCISQKSIGFPIKTDIPISHGDVRILLYFDEAHDLANIFKKNVEESAADTDKPEERSALEAVRSSIQELHSLDIFALFLSTNSNLSVFKPKHKLPSSRAQSDAPLQPPFVELPFDLQIGGEPLAIEGKHTLEEVCKPEFYVRFGRPLWRSRWDAGNKHVRDNIILFAAEKLAGKDKHLFHHDPKDSTDLLAALSVRLLLDFEPPRESGQEYKQDLEARLVENHMRIAFSVPAHCEYMRTGAPSEPILADAAALIMNGWDALSAELARRKSIPHELLTMMKNSWISKGERGEIVARLLFSLARDAAVKTLSQRLGGTQYPSTYSVPIPLEDIIKELFQEPFSEIILNSTPENMQDGKTLREAFKDAKVNFSHFVKAQSPAVLTDEYAWALMVRGIAMVTYDQQKSVDLAIPLRTWDKALGRFVMSMMFIEIKNRRDPTFVHVDMEAPDMKKYPFFAKSDDAAANTRPYIVIIAEFGLQFPVPKASPDAEGPSKNQSSRKKGGRADPPTTPSKVETRTGTIHPMSTRGGPPEQAQTHPRYVIHARGCSPTVYKVIEPDDKHDFAALLASRDLLDEHPRQDQQFLDAVLEMKPYWVKSKASFGWAGFQFAEYDKAVIEDVRSL